VVPEHLACVADDMIGTLRDGQPLWCDGREEVQSLAVVRAVYESVLNREKLIQFAGW
jgi:hypothetical protein